MIAGLAIVVGACIITQSAVNSKLRTYIQSPLTTTMISFLVGTIALLTCTLLFSQNILSQTQRLNGEPFWIYSSGLLGVIFITMNLLLFNKLGGIQSSVLPIFGQIIMGLCIDYFGWLYVPASSHSMLAWIGLLFVVTGVFLVTSLLQNIRNGHVGWKLLGIAAGMLNAMQAAINAHVGVVTDSPFIAAAISFIVGSLILVLLVAITKQPVRTVKGAISAGSKNWWIWTGGVLGACYALGFAFLVPKIGASETVVIALFGQLLCSVCIDKFGLFGAMKKTIHLQKLMGLLLLLIGVIMMKFL